MNGQTVYLDVNYAMENGGGPITHLWLMDESGDNPDQTFVPEERAIAAEAERDRLLEYRERHDSLQRAKLAEIRDENEKLRELVRDMFEEIEYSGFDPYVERQGKRGSYYEEDPSWRVGIRERIRELGIEVEDDD